MTKEKNIAVLQQTGLSDLSRPDLPRLRPEKIHALTSLRFFAALFVVFYHTLWSAVPAITRTNLAGHILSLGFLSVSFFFLLSGYILGMVYLRSGKPLNKRTFLTARFARIYPLYFLTLIADTPFLLSSRIAQYGWTSAVVKTTITFIANIFMLQAWILALRGIDNPNWSLSVETVFYLLFPFIGIWIWKLRGPGLWIAAVVFWLGGQGIVYALTPHVIEETIKFNPLLHISTFALGIVLARWQTLQREKHGTSPKHGASIAMALLLTLAICAALVHWLASVPMNNLNDGLMAPAFGCLIWAFSANRSLPARILSAPWLVVLGEASYGLYLIHLPVYHVYERLHLVGVRSLYPVYLCTCIGLSVLSFYLIETPVRKWILTRLQTRPKETMEAASDAQ